MQRLGNDLVEDVAKLMLALQYMSSAFTEAGEKATAAKSAMDRHDHAKALADELLKEVRDY